MTTTETDPSGELASRRGEVDPGAHLGSSPTKFTSTPAHTPSSSTSDPEPPDTYRLNRDRRLALRRVAAKLTTRERLKTCGGLPCGPGGVVTILRGDVPGVGVVAGAAGVGRCGYVHLCPWCGAYAREERAREIERYTSQHLRAGGSVWFGAFTVASQPGEAIEDSTSFVQEAWSAMWSGRWAEEFKAIHGVLGTVRAFEWTIRLDGSGHPHIHPLFFLARPLDMAGEVEFYGRLILRWKDICAARGRYVAAHGGVNLTPVVLDEQGRTIGLGDYVSKSGSWGIGRELARTDVKRARRGGSLSPWELLAFFAETGETAARDAWRSYERAAAGKQVIAWPRGLKARLDEFAGAVPASVVPAVVVDVADEDEDEVIPTFEGSRPVATIDYQAWRFFFALGLDHLVLRVTELAEHDEDVPGLLQLLAERCRAPGAVVAGITGPPE